MPFEVKTQTNDDKIESETTPACRKNYVRFGAKLRQIRTKLSQTNFETKANEKQNIARLNSNYAKQRFN